MRRTLIRWAYACAVGPGRLRRRGGVAVQLRLGRRCLPRDLCGAFPGENWNGIYFDQHRATWDSSNALATIYFLCLFVIGNLLLFNLFIAILLSSFDEEPEEEEGR